MEVIPATVATGPASLRALYEQEYRAMLRVATLLVGSVPSAEDIVQDAFVRVHDKWATVREPAAYLRTTVVNGCRSQQRRDIRARHAARRMHAEEAVVAEVDELGDALAALSHRQRSAVVLRYYLDLSEADIAATLGCRPGTVKGLLHRGVAQLRKVIE